mmetsp:Transcript_11239/g.38312  ORF Transcript_11239/g.38312 Transcript_11239/m.38312 type:complete len:326 (+) Transcript_11239:543-1520(+)
MRSPRCGGSRSGARLTVTLWRWRPGRSWPTWRRSSCPARTTSWGSSRRQPLQRASPRGSCPLRQQMACLACARGRSFEPPASCTTTPRATRLPTRWLASWPPAWPWATSTAGMPWRCVASQTPRRPPWPCPPVCLWGTERWVVGRRSCRRARRARMRRRACCGRARRGLRRRHQRARRALRPLGDPPPPWARLPTARRRSPALSRPKTAPSPGSSPRPPRWTLRWTASPARAAWTCALTGARATATPTCSVSTGPFAPRTRASGPSRSRGPSSRPSSRTSPGAGPRARRWATSSTLAARARRTCSPSSTISLWRMRSGARAWEPP